MGRARSSVARHRVPWPRRLLMDPAALRYWLLVAALAVVVGAVVARAIGQAEAARSGWGRTETVLVLAGPVEAGEPLELAAELATWPRALVPRDALTDLPPGARATVDLGPGIALVPSLLDRAANGERTDDRRTVALPAGRSSLPVSAGDRVDVWRTEDPLAFSGDGAISRRIASGSIVVTSEDDRVVVAVEPGEVPAVAEASASAAIVLVGSG